MPPRRSGRSASRRSTPSSPPKQVPSTQETRLVTRSARSESRELGDRPPTRKDNQHLSALDEEDTIEVAHDVRPVLVGDLDDFHERDEARSSVPPSDSFYDSDTSERLAALDLDLMIDNLPALYQDSGAILKLFEAESLATVMNGLQNPASTSTRRLQNFCHRLSANVVAYGDFGKDGGRLFLDVSLVVRRLANQRNWDDVPAGPWRPDLVLHQANLALLLQHLFIGSSQEGLDTVSHLFKDLPYPVIELYAYPELQKVIGLSTAEFAISVCTQFFLNRAEREMQRPVRFQPDALLQNVFLDEDRNYRLSPSLVAENAYADKAEAFEMRMATLSSAFSPDREVSASMEILKTQFPKERFLSEAANWVLLVKKQLDRQILAQGGVDLIYNKLEARNFADESSRVDPGAAATQLNHQSNAAATQPNEKEVVAADVIIKTPVAIGHPSSSGTDQTMQLMLRHWQAKKSERKKRASGTTVDSNTDHTPAALNLSPSKLRQVVSSPGAEARDEDDQIVDNEEELPLAGMDKSEPMKSQTEVSAIPRTPGGNIISSQNIEAVLKKARDQQRQSNKENIPTSRRFIDRQVHAERMEWDSQETPRDSVKKRSRAEEVDNDSDDFETDERPSHRSRHIAEANKRRATSPPSDEVVTNPVSNSEDDSNQVAIPPQSQRDKSALPSSRRTLPYPSTQPGRTYEPPPSSSSRPTDTRPPPSTAPAARPRPSTRLPSPDPDDGLAKQYNSVNEAAKRAVLERRMVSPTHSFAQPQVRRAWEEGEVERLLEMIEEHGCAWAKILYVDSIHPYPQLQRRTQVQLKDKARNIKMDYLKARRTLPPGFAAVTMKNKDLALLRDMDLPYEP